MLTVSAPRGTDESWFARFTAGLAQDQKTFAISLFGGDTTSTPGPFSLTVTAIGHVATGEMVRRAGARPGDELWVTGTIGDGALGLRALRGEIADPLGQLAARYRLPQPRLGLVTPVLVRAAMDVSDGLVQDLGHLCAASAVGAVIEADLVPRTVSDPAWLATCLTGGDDYELMMAVDPATSPGLRARADHLGIAVTRIGRFESGDAVRVVDPSGRELTFDAPGWTHF